MKSIFVTGTDTGVGKTIVTGLLVARLRSKGIDAGFMKPVASGCIQVGNDLISEDVAWLSAITGIDDDPDLVNPLRFEEPLAPLVAARRIGRTTENVLEICSEAFAQLQQLHECIVVEGVGGLLVPIAVSGAKIITTVDLINVFGLPVVVVSRRTLGTINHTLLTCGVELLAPAYISGLIFCDAKPVDPEDLSVESSPKLIQEMTTLPILGQIPYLAEISREKVNEAAVEICLTPLS